MAKNKNPFAFLSGIALGGAVGAAIATLFTPQSGKETRKQLKEKGGKVLDDSKKTIKKVKKDTIDPLVTKVEKEAKDKLDELKGEAKEKLGELKNEAEGKLNELKDKVNQNNK